MKPIFNKIFNQIDKIYSEQTGMIYPVSAAVGGGPVPPTPSSKITIKSISIAYLGNAMSFRQVWDTSCYMTFNEPEPENWEMHITMPNVYAAEPSADPHTSENTTMIFNASIRYGILYDAQDPAWIIGDFPTTAHVEVLVDGEVWTECDVTNIINTTDNNPDYFSLVDNAITFEGNQDGTYNITFTTDNYSLSSLASGWDGYVEIPNYETYIHQYVKFDITNVTNNSQVVIPNVTLNNPVNSGDYLNGYGYDANGIQNFGFNGEATVIPFDPGKDYFKVENMGGNTNRVIVTKHGNPSTGADLSFSTDKDTWTLCTYDQNNDCSITLDAHEAVYFRSSTGLSQNYDAYYSIDSTNPIAVSGDLRTLMDYTNDQLDTAQSYGFYRLFYENANLGVCAIDFTHITTLNNHCYFSMFEGCTMMTATTILPSTTLATCCYNRMYYGCTSLVTIPTSLPATTLTAACYAEMFKGCTSLRNAIQLPATTLASNCYLMMFEGCTSLTTTYTLPATVLTNGCYQAMFKNCTSLVNQPTISATTLAEYSCREMFSGCTSLTNGRAPQGATILTDKCYQSMYKGCTSLTNGYVDATTLADNSLTEMYNGCSNVSTITSEAEEWSDGYSTNWVQGVAASGTFYNNGNATIPTGDSGIPTGWTVE